MGKVVKSNIAKREQAAAKKAAEAAEATRTTEAKTNKNLNSGGIVTGKQIGRAHV